MENLESFPKREKNSFEFAAGARRKWDDSLLGVQKLGSYAQKVRPHGEEQSRACDVTAPPLKSFSPGSNERRTRLRKREARSMGNQNGRGEDPVM